MLQTRFSNKKDNAPEGDLELTRKDDTSEFSSDDSGESDTVEAEVAEDDDLVDDEHKMNIESPPSKNSRGSGVRVKKSFNEVIEQNFRGIHSKSRGTKKSLSWAFYEPFDVDAK